MCLFDSNYSKICLKQPLKNRGNKDLKDKWTGFTVFAEKGCLFDSNYSPLLKSTFHVANTITCFRFIIFNQIFYLIKNILDFSFTCTVKSQLSERRLSETTGLFEDDGQSRLFSLLSIAIKLPIIQISIIRNIQFFEVIRRSRLKKLLLNYPSRFEV